MILDHLQEVLARLLVLLQDAITSNQLAVHILMVSIHLMALSLSLDMAKGSLLYSCGFQNTWVISMVFFITESGVLAGPSLFGTNLL